MEVRVYSEGTLRFVQASGSGRTWATAATPASGLLAYCRSFEYTSAQTVQTVMERGNPDHHKVTQRAPIDVTFRCGWTGGNPTALSGSGATVPMIHLEHRASAAEIGNGTTGVYHQFIGGALISQKLTEGTDENTIDLTYRFLGMQGPTGSGYLS